MSKNFEKQYLKYKEKYLNLKNNNQVGGAGVAVGDEVAAANEDTVGNVDMSNLMKKHLFESFNQKLGSYIFFSAGGGYDFFSVLPIIYEILRINPDAKIIIISPSFASFGPKDGEAEEWVSDQITDHNNQLILDPDIKSDIKNAIGKQVTNKCFEIINGNKKKMKNNQGNYVDKYSPEKECFEFLRNKYHLQFSKKQIRIFNIPAWVSYNSYKIEDDQGIRATAKELKEAILEIFRICKIEQIYSRIVIGDTGSDIWMGPITSSTELVGGSYNMNDPNTRNMKNLIFGLASYVEEMTLIYAINSFVMNKFLSKDQILLTSKNIGGDQDCKFTKIIFNEKYLNVLNSGVEHYNLLQKGLTDSTNFYIEGLGGDQTSSIANASVIAGIFAEITDEEILRLPLFKNYSETWSNEDREKELNSLIELRKTLIDNKERSIRDLVGGSSDKFNKSYIEYYTKAYVEKIKYEKRIFEIEVEFAKEIFHILFKKGKGGPSYVAKNKAFSGSLSPENRIIGIDVKFEQFKLPDYLNITKWGKILFPSLSSEDMITRFENFNFNEFTRWVDVICLIHLVHNKKIYIKKQNISDVEITLNRDYQIWFTNYNELMIKFCARSGALMYDETKPVIYVSQNLADKTTIPVRSLSGTSVAQKSLIDFVCEQDINDGNYKWLNIQNDEIIIR